MKEKEVSIVSIKQVPVIIKKGFGPDHILSQIGDPKRFDHDECAAMEESEAKA